MNYYVPLTKIDEEIKYQKFEMKMKKIAKITMIGLFILLTIIATKTIVEENIQREQLLYTDTEVIRVSEGESLWDIANQYKTSVDKREIIHRIMELNHLNTNTLQSGQALIVPLNRG